MALRSRRPLLAVLIAAPMVLAQNYPGQNPYPGQGPYPQGQDPNQYPNQYPNSQGPLGLPLPKIRLPKRAPKDDKTGDKANTSQGKLNLRAVDGTLRELGEKNVYIEASNRKLFRFRVLEKTQFRNKDGETVRDSLLKAGDQLSVQVGEDDPETALRIVVNGKGTMTQRTEAERPFDHDSAKVAVLADTHAAGTMDGAPAPASAPVSAPAPTLESKADPKPESAAKLDPSAPAAAPAPVAEARRAPPAGHAPPVDDVVDAARNAADALSQALPNFIVQQVTTRNYSTSYPARWKVLDVVSAEVVSADGKEEYRNIMVDGKPSNRPIEKTGAWSTGEFASTLTDILNPYSQTSFTKSGEDQVAGRKAYVYNFTVLRENSNWNIIAPDGKSELPAYSGSIWFDKESKNVLRIEERTGTMSPGFVFDKAESVIDYDFIRIDSKTYLLPIDSATLTCQRGTSNCTRNDIRFQNYKKFEAKSSITFDK